MSIFTRLEGHFKPAASAVTCSPTIEQPTCAATMMGLIDSAMPYALAVFIALAILLLINLRTPLARAKAHMYLKGLKSLERAMYAVASTFIILCFFQVFLDLFWSFASAVVAFHDRLGDAPAKKQAHQAEHQREANMGEQANNRPALRRARYAI